MGAKSSKESFRDSIGTVDADGKRRWVYPKQPEGRFYNWRSYLSYVLLAVLFVLPWIKIGGEPLFLFNVIERRFILFGLAFSPQDFHLFAILMITAVVFIILFTVVFGRLFCGWICPQTIFMEMVFRKIEYAVEGDGNAQKRLNKAPWTASKVRKKVLKHGLFLLVSALIAHTFLAYVIGTDELIATVSQSPFAAPGGFLAIVVFIGIFYFVFANLREQVCIAICPYGRLQGVLLDDNSINVIYDYERGEPRGKIRRKKKRKPKPTPTKSPCADCGDGSGGCATKATSSANPAIATARTSPPSPSTAPASAPLNLTGDTAVLAAEGPEENPIGDCIACTLCVQVCPTGIDIRNGIQMECVNCTACIDACDAVMDKIDRPRGLIRYDSESGVARGIRKIWTKRVKAYSVLLLALIALNVVLLTNRDGLDVILLRTPGTMYQTNADGSINNLYTYQMVNKRSHEVKLSLRVLNVPGAEIRFVGDPPKAAPGEITEGAMFIDVPADPGDDFNGKLQLEIISEGDDTKIISTTFLHPKKKRQ